MAAQETEQQQQAVEAAQQELARRELARRRLMPFVQYTHEDFVPGWFLRDLAARLDHFRREVEARRAPRLIINMPPRRGKSQMVKSLVAQMLGNNPKMSFIYGTYANTLAKTSSQDVMDIINSEEYRRLYPNFEYDQRQPSVLKWKTSAGGVFFPVGVGQGVAGHGADVLIIDDPHKDVEAYSEVVRERVWRWYNGSAITRLLPGGGAIIIQTRWSLADLTGRILENAEESGEHWDVICYPEILEDYEYEILRPGHGVYPSNEPPSAENERIVRRKGEILHPERWSPEQVFQQRASTPAVEWSALYQQDPTSGEAALFTSDRHVHLCTMADLPAHNDVYFYTTTDLAISQSERADYSVILTAGLDFDDNLWVYDVRRERISDGQEVVEAVIDNYEQYKPAMSGVEKEKVAQALWSLFERRIRERGVYGMNLQLMPHKNRDKVLRSRSIQGRMASGKVYIPQDAEWSNDFIKEILEFPSGQHDDQVDALSWVGIMLDEMNPPTPQSDGKKKQREKSWKDKLKKRGTGGSRPSSWLTA